MVGTLVAAAGLVGRSSVWLLPLDLLAAAVALSLLAAGAAGLDWGRLTLPGVVKQVLWPVRHLGDGIAGLLRWARVTLAKAWPNPEGNRRVWLRGLLLAVPLVAIAGAILASADALFASYLVIPGDSGGILGDVSLMPGPGPVGGKINTGLMGARTPPELDTALVSNVTAPVRANALPLSVAPVATVIDACDSMFP